MARSSILSQKHSWKKSRLRQCSLKWNGLTEEQKRGDKGLGLNFYLGATSSVSIPIGLSAFGSSQLQGNTAEFLFVHVGVFPQTDPALLHFIMFHSDSNPIIHNALPPQSRARQIQQLFWNHFYPERFKFNSSLLPCDPVMRPNMFELKRSFLSTGAHCFWKSEFNGDCVLFISILTPLINCMTGTDPFWWCDNLFLLEILRLPNVGRGASPEGT